MCWPFLTYIWYNESAGDFGYCKLIGTAIVTYATFVKILHTVHSENNCDILHSIVLPDDVIKSKHFPRYWPFVRGIHR